MLRRLLNLLVTLSLLISLTSAAFWLRTHWRSDEVAYLGKSIYSIDSLSGFLRFTRDYAFLRGSERIPDEDDATFEKRLRPDPAYIPPQYKATFYTVPVANWSDDGSTGFAGFNFSRQWLQVGAELTRMDLPYHKEFIIQAPYWFLILFTAPWPILRILRSPARRRRKRQQLNQCPQCGYDLRASPTRCPECGSIPLTIPTNL